MSARLQAVKLSILVPLSGADIVGLNRSNLALDREIWLYQLASYKRPAYV
jgi:hypothetical protein